MITITEKSNCCGCEACVQVCPQQCIRFEQDDEGFYYPEINTEECLDCGLCERVCPELHQNEAQRPIEVLAAINKDEDVRMNSSSGGVFTLLANHVIDAGGVVFGVRFDEKWQAVFDCAETHEQVAAFRGSKYVQARVGNSFVRCKQLLDEDRQVLFSGTPCQIAALHRFLRKPYDNLLTVDFICHGVPSPKVWERYLDETVTEGRNAIDNIRFRDKCTGWKRYSLSIDFVKQKNSHTQTSPFTDNMFMRAFLANLTLRPSCHHCPAKAGRSGSDITIGDFWGIDIVKPDMDDNRGTSVVMINSTRGQKAVRRDFLKYSIVQYDDIVRYNVMMNLSANKHPHREMFFKGFNRGESLHMLMSRCLKPSVTKRLVYIAKDAVGVVKKKIQMISNAASCALKSM